MTYGASAARPKFAKFLETGKPAKAGNFVIKEDSIWSYRMQIAKVLRDEQVLLRNDAGLHRSCTTSKHMGVLYVRHPWVRLDLPEEAFKKAATLQEAALLLWGPTGADARTLISVRDMLHQLFPPYGKKAEKVYQNMMDAFVKASTEEQMAMQAIWELQLERKQNE